MTKNLAGKLGIPREGDRADVAVDTEIVLRPGGIPDMRPVRVHWPDGRNWPIDRVTGRDEYGSPADGNLVIRWRVMIGTQPKILYQEGDRWYVRARRRTGGSAC